ncbi:MAG: hypothetical protein ACMUIP_10570 [bacterium]
MFYYRTLDEEYTMCLQHRNVAILIMANCFIDQGFLLFVSLNAQLLRTSLHRSTNSRNPLYFWECAIMRIADRNGVLMLIYAYTTVYGGE